MKTKIHKYGFVMLMALMMVGCAAYRTNSDISFDSINMGTPKEEIIITKGTIENRKCKEIGEIEAKVKKLTVFHHDPTEAQVNVVLSEKAKKLGADAVIHVTYKSGIGLFSWGVITARGIAVKFVE